jgi:hypothetical protein
VPRGRSGGEGRGGRLGLGVVAEAVEEAAEHAALAGQGGSRQGSFGTFPADGLVVVGARDRVDDPGLVECVRTRDLRNEADQVPVEQRLGLEAGDAFGTQPASACPSPPPSLKHMTQPSASTRESTED